MPVPLGQPPLIFTTSGRHRVLSGAPVETEGADAFMQVSTLHSQGPGGGGNIPINRVERFQDVIAFGSFARFLHGRTL